MSATTPGAPDEHGQSRSFLSQLWTVLIAALVTAALAGGLFYVVDEGWAKPTPSSTVFTATDGPEINVPVEVVQGWRGSMLLFVEVSINEQGPYTFAVDTGASRTIISTDLVRELGLKPSGNSGQVTGVTGTTQANLVELDAWRINGVTLPGTTAMSLDLPKIEQPPEPLSELAGSEPIPSMDGLLGSDVLSQFGTILIDYKTGELVLRPAASPS